MAPRSGKEFWVHIHMTGVYFSLEQYVGFQRITSFRAGVFLGRLLGVLPFRPCTFSGKMRPAPSAGYSELGTLITAPVLRHVSILRAE